MKNYLIIFLVFTCLKSYAQNCSCETEFLYIKNFIEQNYAGFKDKQAQMTRAGYEKMTSRLQLLSKSAKDNCLLIISEYIDSFKDQHIQISARFDAAKFDTAYINRRGIDNAGIKPRIYLDNDADWIKEAIKILEQ